MMSKTYEFKHLIQVLAFQLLTWFKPRFRPSNPGSGL